MDLHLQNYDGQPKGQAQKKKGDNQKGGDLKKVIDPSLPSLREGYLPAQSKNNKI